MPDTELDYDVALSFAGEDREYVDEVASYLKNQGVPVFYDQYEKANLWGKNLYDHLAEIYSARSKYVVMFISKHYAEKVWPNHERKSAQAKALRQETEFILPARVDDTEIPGLPPTIGYIDLSTPNPRIRSSRKAKRAMFLSNPIAAGVGNLTKPPYVDRLGPAKARWIARFASGADFRLRYVARAAGLGQALAE
jgi:hypothetical protein